MEHETGYSATGDPDTGPAGTGPAYAEPLDVIGTEPSGGRTRRTATIAAAAALLVTAGGAAAWAAGTAPDPSGRAGSDVPVATAYGYAAAPDGDGFQRHGRLGRGLHGALHGELTVKDGTGYKQVAVQRGKVTAVSPTSLTVQSDDGYGRTYVLDAHTRINGAVGDTTSLAAGDVVHVLADLAGSTATATVVREKDAEVAGERPSGPRHRGGPTPGTSPAPSPSSLPSQGAAPEGQGSADSGELSVAPAGRTA